MIGLFTALTIGLASFYSTGKVTANGERYNPSGISCAHRHLPFGTQLRVTDTRTGKSISCRVNDRGPYIKGRIVDLSYGAAQELGITGRGVAKVTVATLPNRPRGLTLASLTGASPSYGMALEGPRKPVQAVSKGRRYGGSHRAKRQPVTLQRARKAYSDGRPRAWCGWWMRQQLGGGPSLNVARNWARWGSASPPQVGAVVVWPHHVGMIVGHDSKGWLVKSGNYGNRVAVHRIYGRPIAYRI